MLLVTFSKIGTKSLEDRLKAKLDLSGPPKYDIYYASNLCYVKLHNNFLKSNIHSEEYGGK